MGKGKTRYTCQNCGFTSIRWLGQCSDCGKWNSMQEEAVKTTLKSAPGNIANVCPISDIAREEDYRIPSTLRELDRVLGGGIVPGSLILVGGDPGIGKSTLLLQVAAGLARGAPVLYVSGEESPAQISMRGQRVGALSNNLKVLASRDLMGIEQAVEEVKPKLLVIDSIQTMVHPDISSLPGSVSQIREVGAFFLEIGKDNELPVFLVGHVTKEGQLAGPKLLEHLVDCVLYFEGDQHYSFRIIRCVKNRFGSVNEIGVFQMEEAGLVEVPNPSEIFIAERPRGAPGSAVLTSVEGSRPLLVEVQALVSPTSFGQPQRMSSGVDRRRVSMLLAVLEKKAGMQLGFHDVYVNVAGGLTLSEPAADLSILTAIASSFTSKALPEDVALCGEVGLTGEIRGVPHLGERINEAEKMGFKKFYLPLVARGKVREQGIKLVYVESIGELLNLLF